MPYRKEQRTSIPSTAASRLLPFHGMTLIVIIIVIVIFGRARLLLIIITLTTRILRGLINAIKAGLKLCSLLPAANDSSTVVLPKPTEDSLIRIGESLVHPVFQKTEGCLGLLAPLGSLFLHEVIVYLQRNTGVGFLKPFHVAREEPQVKCRLEVTLPAVSVNREFVFFLGLGIFVDMHVNSQEFSVNPAESVQDT